jgi:hypothetical protein
MITVELMQAPLFFFLTPVNAMAFKYGKSWRQIQQCYPQLSLICGSALSTTNIHNKHKLAVRSILPPTARYQPSDVLINRRSRVQGIKSMDASFPAAGIGKLHSTELFSLRRLAAPRVCRNCDEEISGLGINFRGRRAAM